MNNGSRHTLSAFSFCIVAGVFWLLSGVLSCYVYAEDITDEEMQILKESGKALSESITQSKDELQKILNKYIAAKDRFGNKDHPEILKIINTLEKNNLSKHLKGAVSTLSGYESAIKQVTGPYADLKKAEKFYNRYKPDKNNPLRSLEQISNALEDLNSAIEQFDPSGGVLTKPIRELISFYQQAASSFHGALTRIRNKLKERGGGGIGEGFPADTDKEKAFARTFPGVTAYRYTKIKYVSPGSSREEGEFWENKYGRLFLWRNNSWTELKPGVSGLQKVYDGYRLAWGKRPDLNTLVTRCQVGWQFVLDAEKKGKDYYRTLYPVTDCIRKIVNHWQFELNQYSEKEFIARYVFRNDSRKALDQVILKLKKTKVVEGRVTEKGNPSHGISGASISSSGLKGQGRSDNGGWFTLFLEGESGEESRVILSVNSPGYDTWTAPLTVHSLCTGNVKVELKPEGNEVTVPGLIGMNIEGAMSVVSGLGLAPVPVEGGEASNPSLSNTVIGQSPGKGAVVIAGDPVTLTYLTEKLQGDVPPEDQEVDTSDDSEGEAVTERDGNSDSDQEHLSAGTQDGYSGGLVIAGSSELLAGQGSGYTACDGAGKPYPPGGSYTWQSSVEDVLSINYSGNPTSGTGLKRGSSTIVLHYDGMTAFLDVTVTGAVPDLSGMTYNEAAGVVQNQNFILSVSNNVPDKDNREIVSQSPGAGSELDEGGTITVELGDVRENSGLFSMSGSSTDTPDQSPFSMSGGERTSEDSSSPNVQPLQNNASSNNTQIDENTDPHLSLKHYFFRHVKGGYQRPFDMYYSNLVLDIEVKNVPASSLVLGQSHLIIHINNRVFRIYYFCNQYGGELVFKGIVPIEILKNTNLNVRFSSGNLPEINNPIAEEDNEYWQKKRQENRVYLSGKGRVELGNRQRFFQQTLNNPRENRTLSVSINGKKYADELIIQALGFCFLDDFDSAIKYNGAAINVYNTIFKYLENYDWDTFLLHSALENQLVNIRRQANFYLMVKDNKKEFMNLAQQAFDICNKLKKNKYSRVVPESMEYAENMLTIGMGKDIAEPFYKLGFELMSPDQKKHFMENNFTSYPNCRAIFLSHTPTVGGGR